MISNQSDYEMEYEATDNYGHFFYIAFHAKHLINRLRDLK